MIDGLNSFATINFAHPRLQDTFVAHDRNVMSRSVHRVNAHYGGTDARVVCQRRVNF